MTAEQPTMVSTDDRLTAIVERVRHLRGVPHGAMANRYIDDVSFLLQLLSPRFPTVTVDTTRYADGPHTLFDAAGQPGPLVPLDQAAIPTTATDAHTTSRAAGELGALGRHTSLRWRLASAFYYATVSGRMNPDTCPHPGLTDEEAAERAGITKGTPWARCTELRAGGWLEWSGGHTRPSALGNESKVWRMTDAGLREWEKLRREDEGL